MLKSRDVVMLLLGLSAGIFVVQYKLHELALSWLKTHSYVLPLLVVAGIAFVAAEKWWKQRKVKKTAFQS